MFSKHSSPSFLHSLCFSSSHSSSCCFPGSAGCHVNRCCAGEPLFHAGHTDMLQPTLTHSYASTSTHTSIQAKKYRNANACIQAHTHAKKTYRDLNTYTLTHTLSKGKSIIPGPPHRALLSTVVKVRGLERKVQACREEGEGQPSLLSLCKSIQKEWALRSRFSFNPSFFP